MPISMVGSMNKIISKILANRLKSLIGLISSETHSGFVNGRQIRDSIVTTMESVSWLKKHR